MKQFVDITVTVPNDVKVAALQSWARMLVRDEAARQGIVIDAHPQGPHTFADDGIRLYQADGWSLSNRVYRAHIRTDVVVPCSATTKDGKPCRKEAVGRGFIGPVCHTHRNVR